MKPSNTPTEASLAKAQVIIDAVNVAWKSGSTLEHCRNLELTLFALALDEAKAQQLPEDFYKVQFAAEQNLRIIQHASPEITSSIKDILKDNIRWLNSFEFACETAEPSKDLVRAHVHVIAENLENFLRDLDAMEKK